MRWAGHVARIGEKRVIGRKARGKIKTWMDNIKMNIVEIGWDVMD
jgi:hypothetical protein